MTITLLGQVGYRPGGGDQRSASGMLSDLDAIQAKVDEIIPEVNTLGDAGVEDGLDGRLQQTTGLVQQTSQLALTTSWADCPGATVTFTPDVACYALVQAAFSVGSLGDNHALGRLMVDGVGEAAVAYINGNSGGSYTSAFQVYRVALTAAAHTLKLQGQRAADPCDMDATHTRFTYQLVAQ